MSRLSVIVPVYNVEDYLDWCLESLERQTFDDIEILCVDDGSTDSSREKLAAWQQRDARIRIIDKQNGGLSSARNAGIAVARAPYVCFLDSDDRFHPTACAEIVRILDESQADVLTFGATCYPEEAGYPWLIDVLSPRDCAYEGFSPDILFEEKSRPFAWRTACRRDFLVDQDIRFDESVRFGEDQIFDFAIYPRARKTVFSSLKLYDYRVSREGSLMSTVRNDPYFKMSEHVKILTPIFHDWAQAGFLDLCPAEMVAFALDFALYGALKLPDDQYREIADGVRAILSDCWDERSVSAMSLAPVTKRMALRACYRTDLSRLARKKMAFDYYLQQYGKKAAFARLVTGEVQ